jgi:hypothetical protein
MIISVGEILQTILALILCWIFIVRFSIPRLLEWLEAMSIDETSVGKEDRYE